VGLGFYNFTVVLPPEWTVRLSVFLAALGFVVYFSHYVVRKPAPASPPDRPDT